MIRYLGIIFVISACTGIGINASNKLKSYRNSCCRLIEAVNSISMMIRYKQMTFYEIAGELKSQSELSQMKFIQGLPTVYSGKNTFSQEWGSSVRHDSEIGDEEKELLLCFASKLGTSDTSGQLSSLELLSEQLKRIETRRNDEYSRKGKLYRSVGLLAGIMIGIVVI